MYPVATAKLPPPPPTSHAVGARPTTIGMLPCLRASLTSGRLRDENKERGSLVAGRTPGCESAIIVLVCPAVGEIVRPPSDHPAHYTTLYGVYPYQRINNRRRATVAGAVRIPSTHP